MATDSAVPCDAVRARRLRTSPATFLLHIAPLILLSVCVCGCSQSPAQKRAAELARRKQTYGQYEAKVRPVYDAMLRTSSDTDVGLNYQVYSERLRDMNFALRKFKSELSEEEKSYASAQLVTAALDCYVKAGEVWKGKVEKDRGKNPSGCDYELWGDVLLKGWWACAGSLIEKAGKCIGQSDYLYQETCSLCSGSKKHTCPACSGTCKCFVCTKGTGSLDIDDLCSCKRTGACELCKGSGAIGDCQMCSGKGKFPDQGVGKAGEKEATDALDANAKAAESSDENKTVIASSTDARNNAMLCVDRSFAYWSAETERVQSAMRTSLQYGGAGGEGLGEQLNKSLGGKIKALEIKAKLTP